MTDTRPKRPSTTGFHLCEVSEIGRSTETERQISSGCPVVRMGTEIKWHEGAYWGERNVPKLDCGDGCTTR